jgi:predicted transcriptional regulator
MQVSEIMTRLVHTVRADATLEQASVQLRDKCVGFLPVVEEAMVSDTELKQAVIDEIGTVPVVEKEILVGVLGVRDIVVRAIALGMEPKTTRVSEIMHQDFAHCYQDDDVAEALDVMEQRKVRRLIVLDREKEVAGVLSVSDISADDTLSSGEILKALSQKAARN